MLGLCNVPCCLQSCRHSEKHCSYPLCFVQARQEKRAPGHNVNIKPAVTSLEHEATSGNARGGAPPPRVCQTPGRGSCAFSAAGMLCRGSAGRGISVSAWPGWTALAWGRGWGRYRWGKGRQHGTKQREPSPPASAASQPAPRTTAVGRDAARAMACFIFLGLRTALPVFGQKGRDRCLPGCL